MTHTFKKFTPLFLAGILCLSAAPAHSAESWSSFALKGVGAYAAYLGIGLGSTIAHEYGHAIAAEILEPGSVDAIVIGAEPSQGLNGRLRKNRSRLIPIFFPGGFSVLDAFGITAGYILPRKKLNKWPQIAMFAAGPLAGAGFCVSMAAATCLLWQHTQRFDIRIASMAFSSIVFFGGNLAQFYAIDGSDGDWIRKKLGIHKWLYNAIAAPAIVYSAYKILA